MKFHRTRQFNDDFNQLSLSDKGSIRQAFPYVKDALQGNQNYYNLYRIKKMRGHPSIWEGHIKINLCFTFEYYDDNDNEKSILFRRTGTHDIYRNP